MRSNLHQSRNILYRESFSNISSCYNNPYSKASTISEVKFYNNAGLFDGATSQIITDNDWINKKGISVTCRIYLNSWGGDSKGNILSNGKFAYRVRGDNSNIEMSTDGNLYYGTGANVLSLAKWFDIGVSRSTNGTANFYINGQLSGTANLATGTPVNGTTNVYIGDRAVGDSKFDGYISDLCVWDRILSAQEFKSIVSNSRYRSIGAPNLIMNVNAYNKFAIDTTQYHSLTATNITYRTVGIPTMVFNGTTSTLISTLVSNDVFQNGFTVSTWLNVKDAGEGNFIVDKSAGTDDQNGFKIYLDSNRRLNIGINQVHSYTDTLIFNYGIMTHFLASISSAGVCAVYINGESVTVTGNTNPTNQITTTNPLTIGNRSGATDSTFSGMMGSMKIFNRVLTANEANREYTANRWRFGI